MIQKSALFVGVHVFILLFSSFQFKLPAQTSDHLKSQYKSILKLRGEGNYDKAIAGFQQIIQDYPDFSRAYRNLVEAYIFTDDLVGAHNYFENLLKENPQNPYAYYAVARLDFARKKYDQAIEKYQKVIELNPKFVYAYSHRGGLLEVYKAKNELDTAIKFFSDLIEAYPKNACAYYGLARSHIRKYEWEKALKHLAKAIELEPEFTQAYHAMISSYFSTSRYDKVLELSEELLKIAISIKDFEMIASAKSRIALNFELLFGSHVHERQRTLHLETETCCYALIMIFFLDPKKPALDKGFPK